MNGQLEQQPLAELINEISGKGLSGALRLQHEQVKAAVYFEDGKIIYAASNLRQLRLPEYLKQHGLASEEQLSVLGNNRSDLSIVSELRANGTLDDESILPVIANQVTDLLRLALIWPKGSWEFDDQAHLGDPVRVNVDTPSLLLQTARNLPLEFASSRFHDPNELISPVTGVPDFASLSPAEGFVLSRLEGPLKLNELLAISGLGNGEASRTIYGLILGGFLQRQHKPIALKGGARKVSRTAARPPVPEKSKESESVASAGLSGKTEEEELNEFFARLENANDHYAVLNVTATAGSDDIKNSYYALARRYHPDRFHLQASTPLHARIESAFARLAQAYGTLTDERQRSTYDSKLAAQEKVKQFAKSAPKASTPAPKADARDPVTANKTETPTPSKVSDSDRAENSFKEGFAALQQGHSKLAVTHLSAASRIAPQEPRYRAYYGKALAALADTRRLAEAEMLAAIKLDPGNATYRIMLAELYCELGFYLRAEGEIERALASEPNNTEARALLRRVEEGRTSKKKN